MEILPASSVRMFAMASAIAVVLIHLSFYRSASQMKERFLRKCGLSATKPQESQVADARVDEVVHKVTQKVLWVAADCSVHLSWMLLLWLLYELSAHPGAGQVVRLSTAVCPYVLTLLLNMQVCPPTLTHARIIKCAYFITFIGFTLAGGLGSAAETDPVATQAFQVSCRFIMTVLFVDSAVVVPCQALASLAECWSYWMVKGEGATSFIVAQGLVLGITAALSMVLQLTLRSHVRATLASADAGSMVEGFRRVLQGICDGEVLLDREQRVCGEARCLQHLLMTSTSLQGRSFPELLVPEERLRFAAFMETSETSVGTDAAAPSCLRVSLNGSCNIRVGVDVFHVPIADLFGSKHHLIALREDVESRPIPESNLDSTDLISQMRASDEGGPARKSQKPASQASKASNSSIFSVVPELSEMTLLIDASSPQYDVAQLHVKYRRSDPSSMPSLRKLVMPTDWETFRSKAARHQQKCEKGGGGAKRLPEMRLRMLYDPRRLVVARRAQLLPATSEGGSGSGSSKQMWLFLQDFAEDSSRCRPEPDLAGIRERGVGWNRRNGRNGQSPGWPQDAAAEDE